MHASTDGSRSGSRWAGGTRKGMAAVRILALARTNRWATVASACRKARAISAVCSPHTRRSVSATWAAGARAGWQQVKISRSWSSAGSGAGAPGPTDPAAPAGSMAASGSVGPLGSGSGQAPPGPSGPARSAESGRYSVEAALSFAARRDSRRARSCARLRAVVMIQAPGLSGTPRRGQERIASTNASWTASSAASRSPRRRARVASTRPDSARNTRSSSRCSGVRRRAP